MQSGFPSVTFVEYKDFKHLKAALNHPNRSVVIEGPSGIGKTTALKKAIKEQKAELTWLTAREPRDREKLQTISGWHKGTIIIDDCHHLEPTILKEIVDLLKKLADDERNARQNTPTKLVIIGIPQTGQSLVDVSFDVEGRFGTFPLGPVENELVIQMIEVGEKALNIVFDRKAEIAIVANGSLNIAQRLCYNICVQADIEETQQTLQVISCDIDTEVERVMRDLERKFGQTIERFAAMGGYRDSTCLRLLEKLCHSEEGALSLPTQKALVPELARSIENFMKDNWIDILHNSYPASKKHLFFNKATHTLIIDDPQLSFHLRRISFTNLEKRLGKITAPTNCKVFISYSYKDVTWLQRLQVHFRPIAREGIIDLWDDTKIIGGSNWKNEIQKAIESSMIAVVFISADFMASEFISEYELPQILSRAESGGTTVLPLIISPSLFKDTELKHFQTINPPSKPLISMTYAEQEDTFVRLVTTIRSVLSSKGC